MRLLIVAALQAAALEDAAQVQNTAQVKPDGTVDLAPLAREGGAGAGAPLRPEAEVAHAALIEAAHAAFVEAGASAAKKHPRRHGSFAQASVVPTEHHVHVHKHEAAKRGRVDQFALDDPPPAHPRHHAHHAHHELALEPEPAAHGHHAHAHAHAAAHRSGPADDFDVPAPHEKHAEKRREPEREALLEESRSKPDEDANGESASVERGADGLPGDGEKVQEVKVQTPWGALIGFTLIPIIAVLAMVAGCTLYGPGSHLNKREEKALLKRNRTRGCERRYDGGEGPFTFMEFQLQYGDEAQSYWDCAQPCGQEEQRRFDNGFGPYTYTEFEAEYGPGPECDARWNAGIPW